MLQVLDDVSNSTAAHRLNIIINASIPKELHPSPDMYVMRPEFIIGLIRAELIPDIFSL